MSSSAKWNQTLKICGITKIKSDIIFLSDIRLSNRNLVSCANDLKYQFINNPYEKCEFFYNSTKNKRGVGILIKKNIPFSVLEQVDGAEENTLLLRALIYNTEVILVSIYGPNGNDPQFFIELRDMLNRFNHLPFIIAGDWNATYSSENIEQNIDCFKMQRLPNLTHSRKINDLCAEYSLTDPFRFLYPEKLEYSYIPRNILANNKSRLDFFIISD
jgi:exonuclease III